MSRNFLTLEDVARLPRGGSLRLDASRAITPRALEEATNRGIRVFGEDGSALNTVAAGSEAPGEGGAGARSGSGAGLGMGSTKAAGTAGLLIISAVGRNRPRVLAEITTAVADLNGDVQDITQRVLQGYFNLMMIVDMARSPVAFEELKSRLESLSREGDYKVMVQREDVFQAMHRV